jgi:hypothetical protein
MSGASPAPEASRNISNRRSSPRSMLPDSPTLRFLTWEAVANQSQTLRTPLGGTRHFGVTPTIWSVKSLPPVFSSS